MVKELKGTRIALPGGATILVTEDLVQADMDALHADFVGYADDVFVVTFPRSGTTWTEQIVHLLLRGGEQGDQRITDAAPWLEKLPLRPGGTRAFAETLERPRLFTSHLPLSLWPPPALAGRVVYVARNVKDVATSMFFHDQSKQGYEGSKDEHFEQFIEGNVLFGSYFDHVVPWYTASQQSAAILFVRYEELQADLGAAVQRIAAFLGVALDDILLSRVLAQSSFSAMSTSAETNFSWVPQREGIPTHYRKGIVGDWRKHLTPDQARRLDDACTDKFTPFGLSFPTSV